MATKKKEPAKAKAVKKPAKRKKKQFTWTIPPARAPLPAGIKPVITIRLACAHTYKAESRPNPRKEWPDPQMCQECKRKRRVVEIHTSRKVSHETSAGN